MLDPQQRVFLECAWEALEDAGYDPEALPAADRRVRRRGPQHLPAARICLGQDRRGRARRVPASLANDKDFLTTRVSYKLDLAGPSVERADGLLHLAGGRAHGLPEPAGRRVRHGAGRRRLDRVPQQAGYLYQEGGILSPDGHCRAFDAGRAGTCGGNGVGIVVLKRLADALADGDTIHAVIKGSAINNDGSAQGRLHGARASTARPR